MMRHTLSSIAGVLGWGFTLALLHLLASTSTPAAYAIATQGTGRYAALQAGDVITVCLPAAGTCPFTSVQAAVDAAQEGDVIKVAAGTYTDVHSYDGLTQVVFVSKTITIRGGYTTTDWSASYPISQPTVLDADRQGRVFHIAGAVSPTIEGLHITGGSAAWPGEWDEEWGAGINVVTAAATIRNNWIYDNDASYGGGGVCLYYSNASLTGNTITSNTAEYEGGGIAVWFSSVSISGNRILGNQTTDDYVGGNGGGIYLEDSDGIVADNIIVNNSASHGGGGALLYAGTELFTGNVITGNSAPGGGGLLLRSRSEPIEANTIISNSGGSGGGILILYGSPTLINTVVAENAGTSGSGIYAHSTSPRLLHTTIANNAGTHGDGIYVTDSINGFSTVVLTNTILVSQTVGVTVTAGNAAALASVLWYGNDINIGGPGSLTVMNEYTGTPDFVDGAYHIGLASDAIDTGCDAGVANDLDGDPRPQLNGYDLGADETGVVVCKRVDPTQVEPGESLTYTIIVTNTSGVVLTAAITDYLPDHVDPSGVLSWTLVGIPSRAAWMGQFTVTLEAGYAGLVTNSVQVSTSEGLTGTARVVSGVWRTVYLPLVLREN